MSRQVVLDTETTGLEVSAGHRLIEIGAVEMVDRRLTGETFHTYINPERRIDEEAREVTGISDEFLLDKPLFADIADAFLAFIKGSELVIHNAPFDVGFLNAELTRCNPALGAVEDHASVLDTLVMARKQYPGQRNSLDALCKRLGIDNTQRDLHGGLLDAQLLAQVYIGMTSGQTALDFGFDSLGNGGGQLLQQRYELKRRPLVLRASDDERQEHQQRLQAIEEKAGKPALWRQWESDNMAATND